MIRRLKSEWPLHLMLLPGLAIILVYSYGPMAGIVMAFQNFVPVFGFWKSEWVGFDNFTYVFSLPDTMKVVWNTVAIALMKITAGLIAPIVTALLLNEVRVKWFKRSVQTLVYMPHFLSWIIVGGILINILSPTQGIVNEVLSWFGASPVYFLGDNHWFRFVLVISNEWKEFGFATIVYLAALTSIDPSLYEAAVVDGAARCRQTWHITLPGMRPVIVLMATLSLGSVLNAGFDQVFVLYSPQVYETGDIIDTMVYRMGLQQMQYSVATAVGLFKSVVSLLLISVSYWLAYRFANYRIF
ncbi:sugar ABC transporter permease [Paenibacillus mesophilus]|uniref:ABC transporter permease n=1 Tax=Paenibacillus mesophilus TaxID=2582849 RepID=UPI00110DBF42|nr:ABC transporter permease subunit [Paenibacillus mesophilus]TMV51874.1 sugar ABC transporter permease [Paenibacillus mesophilus]